MKAIYAQMLSSFFSSPFRITSIAIFIVILNLFLWLIPSTSILDFGFADLSLLFNTLPYIMMVFIPSIFMSFVVEDFEKGTSDWLFSKPLSPGAYWGGHFMGGITIVFIFLLLTLTCYYSIARLALQADAIDHLQILGSYIGILLLSAVFAAISTFAASLSKSQAGAFLLAVLLCYSLFALPSLISDLPALSGGVDYVIRHFSLDTHLAVLARGILELRTIIYFTSLIFLFSILSLNNIQNRLK